MDHKNLEVWKKSIDLTLCIYELTRTFPKEEMYGITQQMRRSAISVPSNIAEGCARKNDKETIQFLYISMGSLAELETQFVISQKLGYCNTSDITEQITNVKQLILGLIKYLKTKS
jgi:four helix bundle protein